MYLIKLCTNCRLIYVNNFPFLCSLTSTPLSVNLYVACYVNRRLHYVTYNRITRNPTLLREGRRFEGASRTSSRCNSKAKQDESFYEQQNMLTFKEENK